MLEFFLQLVSHPFSTLKILLSLWGALGVLIFFWGFVGYFLSHGHIEHQDHARAYMVWGIILTASAILVWEGIRFLASVL
jgi:hypothetical protein